MNSGFVVLPAFIIGLVTGLRSLTAPAIVAWAAHLGWINLDGSRVSFMSSTWVVALFTLGALFEFIADLLPNTPSRTSAVPLIARIIVGTLTGACLGTAAGFSIWLGALIAATGAVAGAFGGYQARVHLVRALHVPDIAIAIPEDLTAIGLGLLAVSRY
jgi:uncharacterized membrane protein